MKHQVRLLVIEYYNTEMVKLLNRAFVRFHKVHDEPRMIWIPQAFVEYMAKGGGGLGRQNINKNIELRA